MFVPSESSKARVDPLYVLIDGILPRPGSLRRQILRSIEERWGQSTSALKLADFGFSMTVLYSIYPGIRVGVSHNLPSRLLTLARGLWRLREEEYEEVIEGGNYRISII
jgi:hypothetical protein